MELFIFFLFLVGLLIASFQDLKRREVDNWLNLVLLLSGIGFIFFKVIFDLNLEFFVLGVVALITMFIVSNAFYYGRVFAGGDAKLLFAMFVVFIGVSFIETAINIGVFIGVLLISGSVWGLVSSMFLVFKDFKKTRLAFVKGFENIYLRYIFLLGVLFFVLSYFNLMFLVLAILFILGPVLLVFGKVLENVVMIKSVSVKDLSPGDWLAENLKIGQKIIKPNWQGLSDEEIKFLKKNGNLRKKIKIKDGVAFVPGFLIGFIVYYFARDWIVNFLSFLF